ncbi:MAG TPA: hypothetical protein VHL11_02640 [Phototrophicaceae bacterium]|jgi:hypothetical protein|nr:hypothetical protein [Phototrophicaceae bacterium]
MDKPKRKNDHFPAGKRLYDRLTFARSFRFSTSLAPDQWYDAVRHTKRTAYDFKFGGSISISLHNLSPDECEFELLFVRGESRSRGGRRISAIASVELRCEHDFEGSLVTGISRFGFSQLEWLIRLVKYGLSTIFLITLWYAGQGLVGIVICIVVLLNLMITFGRSLSDRNSLIKIVYDELKIENINS